jgi:hypothetical protein
MASSHYSGVSWAKFNSKWVAYKSYKGKNTYLGYFTKEEEAHAAVVTFCAEKGIPVSERRKRGSFYKKVNDVVVEQRCLKCKKFLPVDRFSRKVESSYPYCKDCDRDRKREIYSGWTRKEYDAAYAQQGGRCAACGVRGVDLFADHCHKTGRKRGLLCTRCNLLEGMFSDNIPALEGLLLFIKQWERVKVRKLANDE